MRLTHRLAWLGLGLLTVVGFQNCSKTTEFSDDRPSGQLLNAAGNGNGDAYGGKPIIFRHFDLNQPCADTNVTGQPLPNAEIFLYQGSSGGHLVRKECRDIAPVALAGTDVSVQPDSTVRYGAMSFQSHVPADFEVMAALCPAGRAPLASPVRQNMMISGLNLLDTANWGSDGVQLALDGTIAGLPAYRVTRTLGGSSNDFMRPDQYVFYEPNTTYAASFFVKKGNASEATFIMYDSNPVVVSTSATLDLNTGAATVLASDRLTNVTATSRPIAGGFFLTVYFMTGSTVRGGDIGIVASSTNVGDSIFVTGAQVEKVSLFCGGGP